MDPKEYLSEYAALKMEALAHESRIRKAQNNTEMPASGVSDGAQRSPGRGDRFENAVISYIAVKEEFQPLIDENLARMRQIRESIGRLEDGLQREVLRRRYIDVDGWTPAPHRQVAMELYHDDDEKEIQRVKKIHREALEALGEVLNAGEKEESHP